MRNHNEYTIERRDGKIIGVRKQESDEIIPENYTDQRYCDFLTWAAQEWRNFLPDYVFLRTGRFFCDLSTLIKYCHSTGELFWAENKEEDHSLEISTIGSAVSPANSSPPNSRVLGESFAQLANAIPSEHELALRHDDGMEWNESEIFVTQELYRTLVSELKNEDSDTRKIIAKPITRAFVYIDVSDFSKFPPGHQRFVINSIIRLAQSTEHWPEFLHNAVEARICIGDGYIFVLKRATEAIYFGAYLAYLIEGFISGEEKKEIPIEFHFRIGIHIGPVYCFWDPDRKDWNYIGDGINGGQRVLTAAGKDQDDVVFLSGQARKALGKEEGNATLGKRILSCLQNRGRHADKHGNMWRLYEMNHVDFVQKIS